jgi:hypothetical protein
MNICYGDTGWGFFFFICEILIIFILGFFYSRNTYVIFKNGEQSQYEFFDWILIFFSSLQIYILFFSLMVGFFFGFVLVSEILKFSQNMIISGILLSQILIWSKFAITDRLVKIFIFFLITFDLIIFFSGLYSEYSFFEANYCTSQSINFLIVFGLIINLGLIAYTVYKNFEERKDVKSLNLILEDKNNLDQILQRLTANIKTMKKYYLIIIIAFTLSFLIDIYFKFTMTNQVLNRNTTKIPSSVLGDENFTDENILNNVTIDNLTNSTQNYTDLNENIYVCQYYGDFKSNFFLKEYLICFLSFLLRDILPHVYIFMALFFYKHFISSRSSSFIELI